MAGLPPKYAMQSSTGGQAMAKSAIPVALPVDVQLGLMRQHIEQLTTELAELRSQMESECVRQYWNGEVYFPASSQVNISVEGNTLTLNAAGIRITSSSKLALEGSVVDMSAGMVSGNTGMAKFSGVVQCDTIIANSVVGKSYTPGAGNVW